MKRLLILAVLCMPLAWADQSCSIVIDAYGRISGNCGSAAPTPTPTPSPTPAPTPAPLPPAGAGVYQTMHIGGTNNYPAVTGDTVLIYPIPSTWPDGTPVTQARVQFASSPGGNPIGASFEVSFSPVPGDFSYYTSLQGKVGPYSPCGTVYGPDFTLNFSMLAGDFRTCKMDSRQWYLNYRVIGCPAGATCRNTFYVPKGD